MKKFELELNEDNIKETLKNNYLDNNKRLYSLIKLVDEIDYNVNICIDGAWGCGKTFFINQFMHVVKNIEKNDLKLSEDIIVAAKNISDNNIILYYNAWENDRHKDVFQSLIYNILNQLPEYEKIIKKFSNTKSFIKNFLDKYASNQQDFINFDNISTYGELAKDIVTEEEKKKDFKELLNKILNTRRMILIVDELDRCNPIFACELLEIIKHFYDLCNVTIITVANNKELSNTIKSRYGNNFNSYGYLNKIYDFMITLDNTKNIEYSQKVLKFRTQTYLPHNVIYEMFKKYNFTYRECNKYRTMYEMVKEHVEANPSNFFDEREYRIVFLVILPILITFRIKDIDAYNESLIGKTEYLKEALIGIKKGFDNDLGHKDWLKRIVKTTEENEIEEILKIYDKFKKEGINKNIFFDCVRMSL